MRIADRRARLRSEHSVVAGIIKRQLDADRVSPYRLGLKILRNYLINDATEVQKVNEQSSPKAISFVGGVTGRLLFDNFKTCFLSCGRSRGLHRLFDLPEQGKIEDVLVYEVPNYGSSDLSNQEPSIITLWTKGQLSRYHLLSGTLLESETLPAGAKFMHLSWNNIHDTFVVRSSLSSPSSLERRAGIRRNVLLTFLLFQVAPMRFLKRLDVDKKTFGSTLTDAQIQHDMLLMMHSNGYVRIYSLNEVMEQRKPSQGLSVLFEIRCEKHELQIGGFPWHCIITPTRQRGVFHVLDLRDRKMAVNGALLNSSTSLEDDKVYFHPDESGRIFQVSLHELKMFRLVKPRPGVVRVESIPGFSVATPSSPSQQETYTSSGRRVMRRVSLEALPEIIHLDYEDELELIAVAEYRSEDPHHVLVTLFDNVTGCRLKECALLVPHDWDPYGKHDVIINMDQMVLISQFQSKFHVQVFQLACKELP